MNSSQDYSLGWAVPVAGYLVPLAVAYAGRSRHARPICLMNVNLG